MLKKFVVLLACLGVLQITGCTSKDSKEDGGEELAIDATTADSAEVEKVEGEQSLDIAAEDTSSSLSADALPEDALGEASPASQPPKGSAPAPEIAGSDSPPLETLPPDTTLPADTLGDSVAETTSPSTMEASEPSHEKTSSSKVSMNEPKAEPKPGVAYRKVEHSPWKEGGKTLNTVYVTREGDSWGSVSQMIYGSEKASGLKKMNPSIKGRKLKVGDKVYYNSPHRPDDETKILTYYEDSGIAPEVYIAKSGDNLKKVAKEIFGSEQGWKELYATNDFESKAVLDEGTPIKYWRTVAAAPKEVAQAQVPVPVAPSMNEVPQPPPPASTPVAEMPPPPPPEMPANEMAPPPPPPVEAIAPPPPPPPVAAVPKEVTKPKTNEAGNPLEDDQMTTLAAGAVVAVGLALFMIMRRRRKKELEQAIQDTQVG